MSTDLPTPARISSARALHAAASRLVPYRVHNPAVQQEPAWDAPQTRDLAQRACFDCHSNEVVVPWYGRIAPVSWVVTHHVEEGRAVLNFSEWNRPQEEAHESGEEIREGEMPPGYYTLLHGPARLDDAQLRQLAAPPSGAKGRRKATAEATATRTTTESGDIPAPAGYCGGELSPAKESPRCVPG